MTTKQHGPTRPTSGLDRPVLASDLFGSRIDNETRVLCHLVVQSTAGIIRILGVPVDPSRSSFVGCLVYAFDQGPPDTAATSLLCSEEILHVARLRNLGGVSMEEVVSQAQKLSAVMSYQPVHRLVSIEEALPKDVGHSPGERRVTLATVEGVIAIPQWQPLIKVVGRDWPDQHSNSSVCDANVGLQCGGEEHPLTDKDQQPESSQAAAQAGNACPKER